MPLQNSVRVLDLDAQLEISDLPHLDGGIVGAAREMVLRELREGYDAVIVAVLDLLLQELGLQIVYPYHLIVPGRNQAVNLFHLNQADHRSLLRVSYDLDNLPVARLPNFDGFIVRGAGRCFVVNFAQRCGSCVVHLEHSGTLVLVLRKFKGLLLFLDVVELAIKINIVQNAAEKGECRVFHELRDQLLELGQALRDDLFRPFQNIRVVFLLVVILDGAIVLDLRLLFRHPHEA